MIKIENEVIELWQDAILTFYHNPKNPLKKDNSPRQKLQHILRAESQVIRQLWETYTLNRENLKGYLMNPKKMAFGYLLGFHLSNIARLNSTLTRVNTRYKLTQALSEINEQLYFLDLGCGTGALAIAFHHFTKEIVNANPIFELIDNTGSLLDIARHQMSQLVDKEQLITRRTNIETLMHGRAYSRLTNLEHKAIVIGLGYIWNELADKGHAKTNFIKLLDSYNQDGRDVALLILEPANQQKARNIGKLRDELIHIGYQACYPCTHQKSCPILKRKHDWCYSESTLKQPPLLKSIDKILKIDRSKLKMAAYVLVSTSLYEKLHHSKRKAGIVVGRPLEQSKKGRKGSGALDFSYLICTPEGRLTKQKQPKGDKIILRGQPATSSLKPKI